MAPHAGTLYVPRWLGGPELPDTWEITGCRYLCEGKTSHCCWMQLSQRGCRHGPSWKWGLQGLSAAATGLVLVCASGIWGRASVQREKIFAATNTAILQGFLLAGCAATSGVGGQEAACPLAPKWGQEAFLQAACGQGLSLLFHSSPGPAGHLQGERG